MDKAIMTAKKKMDKQMEKLVRMDKVRDKKMEKKEHHKPGKKK